MHAAEQGESTLGIPQSVGKKFVAESHGQNVKKLPQKKKHGKHGGTNFNLSRR
jgi:hypothetical protein